MSLASYKITLQASIASFTDFKRNFPLILSNLKSDDPKNQINFMTYVVDLILNDNKIQQPKKLYIYLFIIKLIEQKLVSINQYLLDNEDLLELIVFEVAKTWDDFKKNQQQVIKTPKSTSSSSTPDKAQRNYLRLLLEFISYLDKNYASKSTKIEDIVAVLKAKKVVFPKKYFFLEKELDKIDLAELLPIDTEEEEEDEDEDEDEDDEEEDDEEEEEEEEVEKEEVNKEKPKEATKAIPVKSNKFYAGDLDSTFQSQLSIAVDDDLKKDYSKPNKKAAEPAYKEAKNDRLTPIDLTKINKISYKNPVENNVPKSPARSIADPNDDLSKQKQPYNSRKISMTNSEIGNTSAMKVGTPKKIAKDIEELERALSRGRSQNNRSDIMQIKDNIQRSMNKSGKRPSEFLPELSQSEAIEVNEKLERQLKELKIQNEIVKQELEYLKRKNEQSAIEDLLAQLERMQTQLTKAQQENTKLKMENAKKSQENEVIISENQTLRQQIEQLTGPGGAIDTYMLETNALKSNYDLLQREYQELAQSQANAAAILTRENNELKQKVKLLLEHTNSLQATVNDLDSQNKVAKKRIADLEEAQKSSIFKGGLNDTDNLKNMDVNIDEVINRTKKNIIETGSNKSTSQPQGFTRSMLKASGLGGGVHDTSHHSLRSSQVRPDSRQQNNTSMQKNLNDFHDLSNADALSIASSNHYQSPLIKKPKGIIITDKYAALEDLKTVFKTQQYLGNFNNFRIACLLAKAALPSNESLQIGITTACYYNQPKGENNIKVGIYFGNMGDTIIESLEIKLTDVDPNLEIKSDLISNKIIMPGNQTKLIYTISLNRIPFYMPMLGGSYISNNQMFKLNMLLPMTINKFMIFKQIDNPELFKMKWRSRKHLILRSEEIELDNDIIDNIYSFKNIFDGLITLNQNKEYDQIQGKIAIKFAGIFEVIIPNVEFLMKIIIYPNNKVVFQISPPESNAEIGKFIIQTLNFIFAI